MPPGHGCGCERELVDSDVSCACAVTHDGVVGLTALASFSTGSSKKGTDYVYTFLIVQELCESRGGRPGLSVLTSLLVSVDVKNY